MSTGSSPTRHGWLSRVLQGLAKPWMDLSRGCKVDDIVNVAVIASLLSE